MYYYLAVAYYSHDLELDGASDLAGPFASPGDRASDLERVIRDEWDLEENAYHVSFLEVVDGKLVRTHSGLAVDPDLVDEFLDFVSGE